VVLDRETLPPAIALRTFSFPHELEVFAATVQHELSARIADADLDTGAQSPPSGLARRATLRCPFFA
jgi:hypothetical protein